MLKTKVSSKMLFFEERERYMIKPVERRTLQMIRFGSNQRLEDYLLDPMPLGYSCPEKKKIFINI